MKTLQIEHDIESALIANRDNQTKVAKLFGCNRSTLTKFINKKANMYLLTDGTILHEAKHGKLK